MPAGRLKFTLHIDGDKELGATLRGRLDRLGDLSPAFERIAQDWRERRVEVFAGEGAFDGLEKWAPLSAKYARWKQRHYPGRLMLVRSGALMTALVFPETDIGPQQMKLTIDNDYAVYHHSSRPRTSNLPRRPLASLGAKQKSRWARMLREHIAGR